MLSRRSARARRRRNARELERRMAELDRLDRVHGLGAMPAPHPRPRRGGRRPHGAALPGLLISGLLVAGVVAFSPGDGMEAVRRVLRVGDHRLAAAPSVPHGLGSYAFLATQRDGRTPVGYDPCRPIEVAVNPQDAPADYDRLVDTAIRHTSAATGLVFDRVGLTDDRPVVIGRSLRRRPVLVAWAGADEVRELAGDVAGVGGSIPAQGADGRLHYVSGKVVLDADLYARLGPARAAEAQAIIDHEFGHLVGLDHVDDPGELMYRENVGVTTYGPGDREGLARLGGIDC